MEQRKNETVSEVLVQLLIKLVGVDIMNTI